MVLAMSYTFASIAVGTTLDKQKQPKTGNYKLFYGFGFALMALGSWLMGPFPFKEMIRPSIMFVGLGFLGQRKRRNNSVSLKKKILSFCIFLTQSILLTPSQKFWLEQQEEPFMGRLDLLAYVSFRVPVACLSLSSLSCMASLSITPTPFGRSHDIPSPSHVVFVNILG